MIAFHDIPADRFAALGSGLGGPEAVADLAAAQSSKRRYCSAISCTPDQPRTRPTP